MEMEIGVLIDDAQSSKKIIRGKISKVLATRGAALL
jgi:hypothetical protein